VDFEKLSDNRRGEASDEIRARVEGARQRQRARFAGLNNGVMTNADMRVAEVRQFCELDHAGQTLVMVAMSRLQLSSQANPLPHRGINYQRFCFNMQRRLLCTNISQLIRIRQLPHQLDNTFTTRIKKLLSKRNALTLICHFSSYSNPHLLFQLHRHAPCFSIWELYRQIMRLSAGMTKMVFHARNNRRPFVIASQAGKCVNTFLIPILPNSCNNSLQSLGIFSFLIGVTPLATSFQINLTGNQG
jgi:hypothetical protein